MATLAASIIGPVALKYGVPAVIGGVLGGVIFYFVTSTICMSLKKHWFLAPLLGALSSSSLIVLLMLSMGV